MKITIGLIDAVTDLKQAVSKDFDSLEHAQLAIENMLLRVMEIGWMPSYILQDGEPCMKKLGQSDYEIKLRGD